MFGNKRLLLLLGRRISFWTGHSLSLYPHTHTHTHTDTHLMKHIIKNKIKIKGRLTTSCYHLHYLVLRSFPDSTPPISAVVRREGHKTLSTHLAIVKVLSML